ncbi:MAG TPA: DNA repair protein RadC [Anaerovoracaceae bacterium]|nr:DNA repair protein RadC [Anaerovoracaceae bacterium]
MNIKKLPVAERPVEKLLLRGASSLSNSELLALIIHTGSREKSAIDLAEELLSINFKGLSYMGELAIEDILKVNGIGPQKACAIMAAMELGNRISVAPKYDKFAIKCSEDVANYYMPELRHKKKEYLKALLLNTKGEVEFSETISVGELSNTAVHPREVFNPAIKKSAAAIIIVHNHPSGDPTPSDDDIQTTKRLISVGEIIGIKLLDHIIIGDDKYVSLKSIGEI